ncbi:AraC family transcriptional regulator [Cohnella nanjingensis]|uniref:AraC family transcriptional regulator n=1 Tax=Cohnella nanjingensis TaxID=1387779 RepID=A0A7X0VIG8_9BACL|nr:AraC family transcriptional regulator [Cohnella nanjingensis]MBB6674936.1 AraC family transcriptional regulator [Cohnella nanjingensis]
MTIQRPIALFRGDDLFSRGLPIYVNRAVETFEVIEHRHDFLEICCVAEGAGTHHIGDRALPVSQGDIFWIPVGVSHVFRPASPAKARSLIVYNCVVSVDTVQRLLASLPGGSVCLPLLDHTAPQRYRDRDGEAQRLFRKLHYEYASRGAAREAALHAGLLELLLLLYRAGTEPEKTHAAPPAPAGLEAVLRLLQGQPERHLPLAEAAAMCGVGERQFHRLFKRQTGMTLTEYAQDTRVGEACRLLHMTDRAVADIAAAVGYQDLPFFNALFKKKTGVAPRDYRRRAGAEDDARTSS